nr:NAD(P)/FAD-dependent oxidoreductase [Haliscomenobacter sp.]
MIQTDILIVGAGPVGLFAVFEAGLLKMRCHLVDSLPVPGGQLAEIYPKKPIYDIPGYPSILAGDLVDRLMEQIAPFNPTFTLGERAEKFEQLENGHFQLTTSKGTQIQAPVIAIAGGLGCFEPRKPPLENLERFEDKGIDYIIRDPEKYRNKRVVIAGGGDSALDWTIFLADVASEVTLIHRRKDFRGAPDSVEKVHELAHAGRIDLLTDSQMTGLRGNGVLTDVVIDTKEKGEVLRSTDYLIPLFGLAPELGPLGTWGLNVGKKCHRGQYF